MFRDWLAYRLQKAALNLVSTKPTFEGMTAMTIYAELDALKSANAALNARVTDLEQKPPVDTSTFASADSVATLSGRVDTIEGEIGTPTDQGAQ